MNKISPIGNINIKPNKSAKSNHAHPKQINNLEQDVFELNCNNKSQKISLFKKAMLAVGLIGTVGAVASYKPKQDYIIIDTDDTAVAQYNIAIPQYNESNDISLDDVVEGKGLPPEDYIEGEGLPPEDYIEGEGLPAEDIVEGKGLPPEKYSGEDLYEEDIVEGKGLPPEDYIEGEGLPAEDIVEGKGLPPEK